METFKNLDPQGRALCVVVRLYPRTWYDEKIDFTNYKHKDIWAVIPVWKDAKGILTSLKTGEVIQLGKYDELRSENWGTAFDYPDGEKIIYTRLWIPGEKKPVYKFVPRTCRASECVVIKAYGEELKEAPKRDRK